MRQKLFISLIILVFLSLRAEAAITTYYGFDAAAGPGNPHPNSDIAHGQFLAAIGSSAVENFEGDPLGIFTGGSRNIAFAGSGVTAVIKDLTVGTPIGSAITNSNNADFFPVSGTNYLFSDTMGQSDFFDITFSTPQTAFGFYGTSFSDYRGTGLPRPYAPITISLDGGSPINVVSLDPGSIPGGSVNFFGVVSDMPFTVVRLRNPYFDSHISDGIAVDDLTISAAAVPEPISLTLWAFGAIGCAIARYRRKAPL